MRCAPTSQFLRSHYVAVLLSFLMVAAFALRFRCASNVVLSADECFSWRLTQYPVAQIVKRTAADVHPPLYYLLLKAWCAGFGTSPAALRGLSAVFGMLCVPIMYMVVREAGSLSETPAGGRSGALFCAFLVAVHITQVSPGSIARMYTLGACLSGLSAWLLLRALASVKVPMAWWSAYGFCVAAFCYTHYYAFFTILAQAVFVGLWLFMRRRSSPSSFPVRQACGFLFAAIIALTLFMPWLPVMWQQTHDVHDNYWISPVSGSTAAATLFSWSSGLNYDGAVPAGVLFASVALAAAYGILRGGQATWFFLLQAGLPWFLSLGLSLLGGRSIFVERYLLFAHFFFLGFIGVVWSAIPYRAARILVGCWIASTALWGVGDRLARYPENVPPVVSAMKELRRHYGAGDLVLVETPTEVNRLRYYASQAGLNSVNIRCEIDSFGKDRRFSHIAALTNEDVLWNRSGAVEQPEQRLWRLSEGGEDAGAVPRRMRKFADYRSEENAGGKWTLTVYAPE
jgi:mannosyltransferase